MLLHAANHYRIGNIFGDTSSKFTATLKNLTSYQYSLWTKLAECFNINEDHIVVFPKLRNTSFSKENYYDRMVKITRVDCSYSDKKQPRIVQIQCIRLSHVKEEKIPFGIRKAYEELDKNNFTVPF